MVPCLTIWVPSPKPTWWEEKAYSYMLSTHTHTHTHTLMIQHNKKVKMHAKTISFFFFFWGRVSLYSPGCPETCSVDQAVPASWVLGVKLSTTIAWPKDIFLIIFSFFKFHFSSCNPKEVMYGLCIRYYSQFFLYLLLEMEPKVLHMLGKHFTNELHLQLLVVCFFFLFFFPLRQGPTMWLRLPLNQNLCSSASEIVDYRHMPSHQALFKWCLK